MGNEVTTRCLVTGPAEDIDCCKAAFTKQYPYPENIEFVASYPLELTLMTRNRFPAGLFNQMAQEFPALVFDVACIDDQDLFAGQGFYNPPPGKPAFAFEEATDAVFERAYGHPRRQEYDDK